MKHDRTEGKAEGQPVRVRMPETESVVDEPTLAIGSRESPLDPRHTEEMARPRSKRALIAGGIAIAVLFAAGLYLGTRGDSAKPAAKETVAPVAVVKPLPPVVAKKSPADRVFDRAELALRNYRVAAPPGDNALELILEGEQLEPANPRAKTLRDKAIDQLLASAELLWTSGKLDSARTLYSDILLFDPEHALARTRSAGMKKPPPAKSGDADQGQVSWLVSEIDLAIIERRLVAPTGRNALDLLIKLRKLDPKGDATRRLGGDVAKALRGEAKTVANAEDSTKLLEAAKVATGQKPATETADPGQAGDDDVEKPRDQALAKQHISKGNALLAAGQLGEARKEFERAISADSAAHGALAGLAEVAYNEGDFTRAVLATKRALGMAPGSVSYRMLLAKAYYKLLRYEDAIKQWKRVLEIDRTNAAAQKNIEMAQRRMGQ